MKVFIVLEEDRGCGSFVVGVYDTLEKALAYINGPEGSNCYLDAEQGSEVE